VLGSETLLHGFSLNRSDNLHLDHYISGEISKRRDPASSSESFRFAMRRKVSQVFNNGKRQLACRDKTDLREALHKFHRHSSSTLRETILTSN
jgi:hypothetical protein